MTVRYDVSWPSQVDATDALRALLAVWLTPSARLYVTRRASVADPAGVAFLVQVVPCARRGLFWERVVVRCPR